MTHDAASLFNDLMSGLAGLVSERTSFDDPGRMTWARWLWVTAFSVVFVACLAAASAFGPAMSRLLGPLVVTVDRLPTDI